MKNVVKAKNLLNEIKNKKDDNVEQENNKKEEIPQRLKKCESILKTRTGKIILVLDRCSNMLNQQAMLRTAELQGIQNVWCIRGLQCKNSWKVSRRAETWLNIKPFELTENCVETLKKKAMIFGSVI
eukprot:UN02567